MRVACLRVSNLPLAAELRAHPELAGRPVVVASGADARAEVVAASPEAARAGVQLRASIAHARAVCAELHVRVASPALGAAAHAALLDAARACSPRAAPAARAAGAYANEAAVYVDATGVDALFCSEAGFAAALVAKAEKLGLPAAVAIASSQGVAHIAARQLSGTGAVHVLDPGAEAAFLAPLPIDLLGPEDELADALTRFGVRRVSDLLALPRRALGVRLGRRALALIALARGEETEAPLPVSGEEPLAEAIDLEHPIERLEPLTFVLQGLLSRLRDRLEARRLACGDLRLTLDLEGGQRDARRVGVAAPSLDLRSLLRLLRQALESDPPRAAALGVALATEGCPIHPDQLDLFRPAGPAPAVLGRTLTELEALCGAGRVGAPQVADSHCPGAFDLVPFRPGRPGPSSTARDDSESAPAGASRISLALRALRPPVSAQVQLASGRPAWIRSAIANGRVLRVAGPWRTTGGWWSSEERFAYDSFDVLTSDGSVARLRFDHLRKAWAIDAIYD